jgi:hypothetical protein
MSRTGSRGPGAGRWFAFTTALLLGAAACGGEPVDATDGADVVVEEADAGSARPPSVPPEFLATPHGWFHPSCVVEVDEGETVQADGVLLRANGEARQVGGCVHARYDRDGRRFDRRAAAARTVPAAVVNGWVASTSSTSVGPIESISATWQVPSHPARSRGQTLYFFPALEPAATGAFILQPVLAWNGYNDRRWTIASWNCCTDGTVLHSAPRPVAVGETITGSVLGSGCDAQGVCASWSVSAVSSRGTSTTLATTSHGAVLDWGFGGAFEAYGVSACSQYPRDGRITFGSIVVRRPGGSSETPEWVPWSYPVTPSCLSTVDAAPDGASVTMTWRTF